MNMNNSYYIFLDNNYQKLSLRDLVKYSHKQDSSPRVWSARISTGIFGLTDCKSGNKGPKNNSEVLLAVGDDGLRKLVDLGFITCPTCNPEKIEGFWSALEETVQRKYNITSLEDFTDKKILSFDSRRVSFEEIIPMIGDAPNRLYVPKGLVEDDLLNLKMRFDHLGISLPPVGYYDPDAINIFTEYIHLPKQKKWSSLKLRHYKDDDFSAFKEILQKTDLYHEPLGQKGIFKKQIEHDPESIILAETDGKVVGGVIILYHPFFSSVWHRGVDPDYQGQGIGSKLMDEAEGILKKRGIGIVGAFVYKENKQVIESKKRRGWYEFPEVIPMEKEL